MKRLILIAMAVLLSAPNVMSQEPCVADFNCDGNVDGLEVAPFLAEWNRRLHINGNPCTCVETSCPCTGPVLKTGQTISYATGDDGDLQRGLPWPNPRFTDNGDGTVTDNLTQLLWLKDANCFGQRTWSEALSDCNGLADGSCELSDGSVAGDWSLPNVNELLSLVDRGTMDPCLPDTHPFENMAINIYWTSSTLLYDNFFAWTVAFNYGDATWVDKSAYHYLLPTRSAPVQIPSTSTTTSIQTTTTIPAGESCVFPEDCGEGYCCCILSEPMQIYWCFPEDECIESTYECM